MAKNIGALWEKTSKNGTVYYTGKIEINGEEAKINVLANQFQNNSNSPALLIYPIKNNYNNEYNNSNSSQDGDFL